MIKIAPGVYDDERGGLHLDLGEVLRAAGFADTAENRDTLEREWKLYCLARDITLEYTENRLPDCVCRTSGCTHRASQHGPGGVCRICERACWS